MPEAHSRIFKDMDEKGKFQGVLDLLDDARSSLVKILLVVFVLSLVSFILSDRIMGILLHLLNIQPISYAPQEAVISILKLSLYTGIILSFPIASTMLLWLIVKKIDPSSLKKVPIFIFISILLFAAGVLLAYYLLLPAGIKFLLSFATDEMNPGISIGKYVDFCSFFLIATGLAHQAPLASYILARAGILTPSFFKGKTRYAIVICFCIAAVVTPTPDVYNMTLMAIPLLILYFASLAVVKLTA
jgi:sec-independent protein translocase protein TatC